jgi:non-ribosomal peptide synthetase component F
MAAAKSQFKATDSLSPADRQLFNLFGLGESVKKPFDCVHHALEHHAKLNPYNIAVEDVTGEKIAYAELDRQANCLARHLREAGIVPGKRVCLLVERSIWMVVGIAGILKAGGAYVPLDGNVVSDKTLEYALKDSGSSLAVVQSKFKHRVPDLATLTLEDTLCDDQYSTHCVKPEDLATTLDSAYIIYTSGEFFSSSIL